MPLGVDLGTTNSSIAWADSAGAVYSLKVRRGPKEPFDAVERSIVLDPLGDAPIVGYLAEGAERPGRDALLVSSFKRRFDKARLRQAQYEWVSTPTGEYDYVNQCIRFEDRAELVPLFYDDYSLDEVTRSAALLLQRLLTSSEIDVDPVTSTVPTTARPSGVLSRLLGRRVAEFAETDAEPLPDVDLTASEKLYVGVPVSFGPTARRRLLRSLVASGCFGRPPDAYREVISRCRLVYEPLALVSTLTLLESQDVLVVDYGGGTLDLALMRVDLDGVGRAVKELALGGLPTAGDQLDERFRAHLLGQDSRLRRSYEQQKKGGVNDRYQADSAFARAKVDLSTRETTTMRLFGDIEVSRTDLEAAIRPELDLAQRAIEDTLERGARRAGDVGTVLLTGGSSLIPAVQERVRAMFPHLRDGLAFDAGTPGDSESERRTLTGVSRGLAQFGFLESFEAAAPCAYSIVIPDTPATRTVVLDRGSPDVYELAEAPPVRMRVRGEIRSVVLYSDLLRETYCGAVADIHLPAGDVDVEVRVSASRLRFAPAFVVVRSDTGEELGRFDLESMTPSDLQRWVEGDEEWMPFGAKHVESAFLTRPLEVGDFVEWKAENRYRRGKVLTIRDVNTGRYVDRMIGFDPCPYVIRAAREENGKVLFARVADSAWGIGDIRLA